MMNINKFVFEGRGYVDIAVYVKPRSSKTKFTLSGELVFHTEEEPIRGKANKSLIKHLAKLLKVNPQNVEIVKGHKSRVKLIRVRGISMDKVKDEIARLKQR